MSYNTKQPESYSFKFTPYELCNKTDKSNLPNNHIRFFIPLYQRLFTWGDEEIQQLLTDLTQACKRNPQTDYYLGMLTVKYNEESQSYEVIDGQQRLTVLILLATLLKGNDNKWNNFLSVNNACRLHFPSREKDNLFFENKILNKAGEENSGHTPALDHALEVMTSFECEDSANNEKYKQHFVSCKCFSDFVFKHLRFFVTVLPNSYNPRRLNQYFDRMNDSGKNLEPHEILLGEYLKTLDSSKCDKKLITELWKKASDLSKPMIDKESICKDGKFPENEINECLNKISEIDSLKDNKQSSDQNNINKISIMDLITKEQRPDGINIKANLTDYSQSLISLNELLLLCLGRLLLNNTQDEISRNSAFFNTSNIIKTFKENLSWSKPNENDIINFMKTFFKSRLLLDLFFLRRDDSGEYLAPRAFHDENDVNEIGDDLATLMRYEEFLYSVESSLTNYRWFNPFLDLFEKNNYIKIDSNKIEPPKIKSLNTDLEKIIGERDKKELGDRKKLEKKDLNYTNNPNRYWFWRLDLALWIDKDTHFSKNTFEKDENNEKDENKELKVAKNYHFRRNRSIEHVAPQNPKSKSKVTVNAPERDDFGNLCMISSGLNSSLKNESFEVKKARVESHLNGQVGGAIESLKLLAIYCYWDSNNNKWNTDSINEHGKMMLNILNNSLNNLRDNNSKNQNNEN